MLSSKVKNRIIFLTTVALITLVAIFFIIQSLDKNIFLHKSNIMSVCSGGFC